MNPSQHISTTLSSRVVSSPFDHYCGSALHFLWAVDNGVDMVDHVDVAHMVTTNLSLRYPSICQKVFISIRLGKEINYGVPTLSQPNMYSWNVHNVNTFATPLKIRIGRSILYYIMNPSWNISYLLQNCTSWCVALGFMLLTYHSL